MQHQDREQLISGILGLIREVSGPLAEQDSLHRARTRIDALLDDFLLESQPIVATRATVLLADIRGFTALTQSLPVATMIELLNEFFSVTCPVIKRYGGSIDKLMGDSVMALFGAPDRHEDDLARALACAVEMQRSIAEQAARNQAAGRPTFYAGISVSTGDVMAGSFGSADHNEYTVIGETVNLAARMESFSLRGQVLLSEASLEGARDLIEVGEENRVLVKGLSAPVSFYELRAVKSPRPMQVPKVEMRRSPRIAVDLRAVFRQVEAERIGSEQMTGRVSDVGYYGMSAHLPVSLPAYTEVVINLSAEPGVEPAPDIYARVLRSRSSGRGFRTSMEFTAIGTPGHRQIKEYVDSMLWGH
jgi:adenylate cyclase